jgi:hypothetical protein
MRRLLILGLAGTLVVGLAPGAMAKDGDVIRRGSCSGATDWKLKAKPDDGGLEVEFEVDQNRNGDRWTVQLRDNGTPFFNEVQTTRPPSGSFSVERIIPNQAGPDRITARAVNQRTTETCEGSLAI